MSKATFLSSARESCASPCWPGLILGQTVKAQSPGSLVTRTYDTALTSDGFGIYHLQFPQFSPDSGTLVSVRISALTNTMYGFTLRNADSVAATYALTVGAPG
jgi:hypothetical protein